MNFTLPWPPSTLNPNARHAHWSKLAKAKGRYRFACATIARSQGATKLAATKLLVRMTFVPPDKRRRDLDNLIGSMKAGLDGLADVLGVDDSHWALAAELLHDQVGGFVKVEVAPWP